MYIKKIHQPACAREENVGLHTHTNSPILTRLCILTLTHNLCTNSTRQTLRGLLRCVAASTRVCWRIRDRFAPRPRGALGRDARQSRRALLFTLWPYNRWRTGGHVRGAREKVQPSDAHTTNTNANTSSLYVDIERVRGQLKLSCVNYTNNTRGGRSSGSRFVPI